jgi:hypothetical protein
MNEWVHESIECSGSGTEPYTDAQFESVAQLVAAASHALGLPINRSTVVVHADINGVSRRSDPWPTSIREARVKRVIDRANAILLPAITTVTVKSGDTLSAIASAHGLLFTKHDRPEPPRGLRIWGLRASGGGLEGPPYADNQTRPNCSV